MDVIHPVAAECAAVPEPDRAGSEGAFSVRERKFVAREIREMTRKGSEDGVFTGRMVLRFRVFGVFRGQISFV